MARAIRGWAEEDCHTSWRHVLCYMKNSSAPKKIKNMSNRRQRYAGAREIRFIDPSRKH